MRNHIEIGCAFWNLSEDKLKSGNWRCFFIEAVPEYCDKISRYFEKLKIPKDTYSIHNVAISEKSGKSKFLKYSREKGEKHGVHTQWLYGTCGFDPIQEGDPRVCGDKILKLNKDLYDEITVNTITFDDFINENNIYSVESIKIDTEGQDLHILNQIDTERLGVKKIQFEHFLAKKRYPALHKSVINKLTRLGFSVEKLGRQDTFLSR